MKIHPHLSRLTKWPDVAKAIAPAAAPTALAPFFRA